MIENIETGNNPENEVTGFKVTKNGYDLSNFQ